jgi:hypothetical protein
MEAAVNSTNLHATDDVAAKAAVAPEAEDVDGLEQQNPLWFLAGALEKFPHAFAVGLSALLIVAFMMW